MNHPSQEDLLGYVLGALDAQEHRDIQRQLDEHPDSEERLLAVKASLSPLDLLDAAGHRPGLARRTCEWVARCGDSEVTQRLSFLDAVDGFDDAEENDRPVNHHVNSQFINNQLTLDSIQPAAAQSQAGSPVAIVATSVSGQSLQSSTSDFTTDASLSSSGDHFKPLGRSWSINDLLVGVGLMGVLAALLLPAVSWSRHHSRLLACQNNLRQVGTAFMLYSSNNNGGFVSIPSEGNLSASGCYGPILKDAGLLAEDSLLACAGLANSVPPVVIPSSKQVLDAITPSEISHLQQTMGGHFGHSMGHRQGDKYAAPRNDGQSFVVLLADRPSSDQPGRVSMNHGGAGQNCLFADGRVAYVAGPAYGSDALFENDYGVVAPGSNELDNVIAPSHLSPSVGVRMTTSAVD